MGKSARRFARSIRKETKRAERRGRDNPFAAVLALGTGGLSLTSTGSKIFGTVGSALGLPGGQTGDLPEVPGATLPPSREEAEDIVDKRRELERRKLGFGATIKTSPLGLSRPFQTIARRASGA